MRILILFLFFSASSVISQENRFDHIEYKNECNNSYNQSLINELFNVSIKSLKRIKKKYKILYSEEYILLAYNYSKKGKNKKAAKLLKNAWSNYFYDLNIVWESDSLKPNLIMRNFSESDKKIVNEGYVNFAKLKTAYSDSIKEVLVLMEAIDQEPRINPKDTSRYTENILETDSLNLRNFQKLIRAVGYPGERLLPGYGNPASILLIHSSYYKWFYDEMKDELLEQVRIGNMAPSEYVLWLDRHNYEFYNSLEYGMLDIPEAQKYSETEKDSIRIKRLKFGLIEHYPIPSRTLQFQ